MVALMITVSTPSTSSFLQWGWIHSRTAMRGASGGVQWFSVDSQSCNTWQVHGSQFPGLASHPSSSFVIFPKWGEQQESGLKPWPWNKEKETLASKKEMSNGLLISSGDPSKGIYYRKKPQESMWTFPVTMTKRCSCFLQHLWSSMWPFVLQKNRHRHIPSFWAPTTHKCGRSWLPFENCFGEDK